MRTIPTDTLLDRDPVPGLEGDALEAFKMMLLGSPMARAAIARHGFSDTQAIDAIEGLRRKGMLVIQVDPETHAYRVTLTPTGAVELFLARIMEKK